MPPKPSPLPDAEAVLQTLPTASAIVDREMRCVAVNARWREAFGGAPDVVSLLPDQLRGVHERCLAGAAEMYEATPLSREDGTVEYVDIVAAPWKDDAGAIVGSVIHTKVATDRVSTQQRLVDEQAFVRALVDKSPVGFNLCRLDGLWVESNPAFLEIIGYTAEEADGGLTYWELTPREYDEAERVQLASLESTGRYGPYEKEFIRKDGSRVPVRLNGFLIERDGEKYIWSLIEDITSERKLEAKAEVERLKASQAAKLASIGAMAAGIAHEINNPLQVIDGFAFELQESLAEGEGVPADAVDAIRKGVERAARIVRGLRKFARDDRGEIGAHAIGELVDEALSLTMARIRNHGVELQVEIGSERRVRCAPLEMTQVLVNLINNAFDAVRDDPGWVRLEVLDDGEDRVAFRVLDSGGGVPHHDRERIFEPFVTTKPPGEGTGLGLSISRGILESMGGTVTYEPDDERTCFVVRLPSAGST